MGSDPSPPSHRVCDSGSRTLPAFYGFRECSLSCRHWEGWSPDRIGERVREMLGLVGLDPDDFGSRYPDELSGGQRQRVGVARALAIDPTLLLLDEPFGALDPITRAQIRKEFRDLQRRLEKTMVFVTHDVAEAFLLADLIGLMKDGRLLALVHPDEFRELDEPEAREFMGSLA